MDSPTYHTLVKAALKAGDDVMAKSASATPEQAEVLANAWPQGNMTKLAALAQMLATGMMVEEAAQAA